jgi:lipoprotein-releasing system permease protein
LSDARDAARALRNKLVAVDAHVSLVKNVNTFTEYREVLSTVEKAKGVVAAEPFVYAELLVASAKHGPIQVTVKGVDPQRVGRVLGLGAYLTVGKLQDLASPEPPAVIVGDALAETLHVRVGDPVTMTLPKAVTQPSSGPTLAQTFRVTGFFHVDFDEYDERLAFASLTAVQKVLNRGDQVMGIEFTVTAIDLSTSVARAIEQTLGGSPYVSLDWYARNQELFRTLFGDLRP